MNIVDLTDDQREELVECIEDAVSNRDTSDLERMLEELLSYPTLSQQDRDALDDLVGDIINEVDSLGSTFSGLNTGFDFQMITELAESRHIINELLHELFTCDGVGLNMSKPNQPVTGNSVVHKSTGWTGTVVSMRHSPKFTVTDYQVKWNELGLTIWTPARLVNKA